MAENGNGRGGFLGGFLIGSVLGALAGLLFAPKSGKELRSELKQ
jgi:gas vesicle protein